eukprot:TRINITY_DN823_c1_g1_i1.p1 TRINITY_DN823_c1_g1~~TRINITY_DN823_c1_g1_i1.p1  ORF type:complete len:285 (+),score=16.22 TRINITY_DN823_c1_g1_i1:72-926(+)
MADDNQDKAPTPPQTPKAPDTTADDNQDKAPTPPQTPKAPDTTADDEGRCVADVVNCASFGCLLTMGVLMVIMYVMRVAEDIYGDPSHKSFALRSTDSGGRYALYLDGWHEETYDRCTRHTKVAYCWMPTGASGPLSAVPAVFEGATTDIEAALRAELDRVGTLALLAVVAGAVTLFLDWLSGCCFLYWSGRRMSSVGLLFAIVALPAGGCYTAGEWVYESHWNSLVTTPFTTDAGATSSSLADEGWVANERSYFFPGIVTFYFSLLVFRVLVLAWKEFSSCGA